MSKSRMNTHKRIHEHIVALRILTGTSEARGELCPAEFVLGRHTVVSSKNSNYGRRGDKNIPEPI